MSGPAADRPRCVMVWGGRKAFDPDWLRTQLEALQPDHVIWNRVSGANWAAFTWQVHRGGFYANIAPDDILSALPELTAAWRVTVLALPETNADRRVIAEVARFGATIIRPV